MSLPWWTLLRECLAHLLIKGKEFYNLGTLISFRPKYALFSYWLSDPNKPSDEQLRNIRWRPFSYKKQYYLDIGDEQLVMRGGLNTERYELWKKLFPLNWRRQSKHGINAYITDNDYEEDL